MDYKKSQSSKSDTTAIQELLKELEKGRQSSLNEKLYTIEEVEKMISDHIEKL